MGNEIKNFHGRVLGDIHTKIIKHQSIIEKKRILGGGERKRITKETEKTVMKLPFLTRHTLFIPNFKSIPQYFDMG